MEKDKEQKTAKEQKVVVVLELGEKYEKVLTEFIKMFQKSFEGLSKSL